MASAAQIVSISYHRWPGEGLQYTASLFPYVRPRRPRGVGKWAKGRGPLVIKASNEDNSYLSMWKRAKQREDEERKEGENLRREAEEALRLEREAEELRPRRERTLFEILQVPEEMRRQAEKQQVVDRAAAALAAANAALTAATEDRARREVGGGGDSAVRRVFSGTGARPVPGNGASTSTTEWGGSGGGGSSREVASAPTLGEDASPGPDFWSWTPPPPSPEQALRGGLGGRRPVPQKQSAAKPSMAAPVMERDRGEQVIALPFESEVKDLSTILKGWGGAPSLPPLQSLLEVEQVSTEAFLETSHEVEFADVAMEQALRFPDIATEQLDKEGSTSGVTEEGVRWWKETGIERRAGGVVCEWTVVRGVSADGAVEFEEKWWETSDDYDYKELGAEKSGRDASGGVWRETWREAMWQDAANGLPHIEKSADKWATDGKGGEWHEKWWEHYDALGHADKGADKWSKIDLSTPLEPGHAHVWHERWGEKYDGHGGSSKYTDKWAERAEYGGGWTKWGDKWDEGFGSDSQGRKQGETWWEGAEGERWNRTWGEEHNGTGYVHKYGQSSSGEHWDTHEKMDTWYERKPHFGFRECLRNSYRLQQVGSKPDGSL